MTGLCECGCGGRAPIAKQTRTAKGHVRGHPVRFIAGHYQRGRYRSHAETLAAAMDKVRVSGPMECWVWTASRSSHGYGKIYHEGREVGAHRFMYEAHVGPIPEGTEIDHLCRNRGCVNPAHLEPVTRSENIRRGASGTNTHCVRGHRYTGESTYIEPSSGARKCRVCRRETSRRYRRRHKLVVLQADQRRTA